VTRKDVKVDVRDLVFPIIGGAESGQGFRHTGFLGTGFFVSRRGLALTAAHVVMGLAEGQDVRAALPTPDGPMRAMKLLWKVALPDSDIAEIRVEVPNNRCFRTSFEVPVMGQDVETTAIPESMLVKDSSGKTKIGMRVAKGYFSHGDDATLFASFALPKGMSGAPMIVTESDKQFVQGVFVGQSRGEQIEDEIIDVRDLSPTETHRHTERVSRVEYYARGDLLAPHRHFAVPKVGDLTLEALIAKEVLD
jgi:hypothetical protein